MFSLIRMLSQVNPKEITTHQMSHQRLTNKKQRLILLQPIMKQWRKDRVKIAQNQMKPQL